MEFIKIETQEILTLRQLKKAHAVSHPGGVPTDEFLQEHGYARISDETVVPDHNPETQVLVDNRQVELVDGVYKFVITVRDKTLDEIEADTASQIKAYEDAVQKHLDEVAQSIGYDNIYTACTYADEPTVSKFQQEGQVLRAWRSLVWADCYAKLNQVLEGEIEKPTIEDLIAGLPTLEGDKP